MLMLEKYPILNAKVKFLEHDFLLDNLDQPFDICTFGFEVSLDLLRKQQTTFKEGAHLIVPLSETQYDLEQNFKVLRYVRKDEFEVVEEVMRTSFAQRIDKQKQTDEALDADYFNNMRRLTIMEELQKEEKELEALFLEQKSAYGKEIKLAELMKDEEIKKTLLALRATKRKIEKLGFAMEDSVIEKKETEED